MSRNELFINTTTDNDSVTNPTTEFTGEQKQALVTAMKIAYYKDFYKRGIITADQLEQLLAMQKEYTTVNDKPAA